MENSGRIFGISKEGWGCDDIVLLRAVLGPKVVGIVAIDGPDLGQFPLC